MAKFWDTKFNRPGPGVPVTLPIAITMIDTLRRSLTGSGAAGRFDFQCHQALSGETFWNCTVLRAVGILRQTKTVHNLYRTSDG